MRASPALRATVFLVLTLPLPLLAAFNDADSDYMSCIRIASFDRETAYLSNAQNYNRRTEDAMGTRRATIDTAWWGTNPDTARATERDAEKNFRNTEREAKKTLSSSNSEALKTFRNAERRCRDELRIRNNDRKNQSSSSKKSSSSRSPDGDSWNFCNGTCDAGDNLMLCIDPPAGQNYDPSKYGCKTQCPRDCR